MAKNTRRYEFTCQTQEQKDKILSMLEGLANKTESPRGKVILEALQYYQKLVDLSTFKQTPEEAKEALRNAFNS